jgi:hypothetical protein
VEEFSATGTETPLDQAQSAREKLPRHFVARLGIREHDVPHFVVGTSGSQRF